MRMWRYLPYQTQVGNSTLRLRDDNNALATYQGSKQTHRIYSTYGLAIILQYHVGIPAASGYELRSRGHGCTADRLTNTLT